jgi:hypothetical protein
MDFSPDDHRGITTSTAAQLILPLQLNPATTWRTVMNARNVTMIAAVLSLGWFTLEGSALAQGQRQEGREGRERESDCRQMEARQVGVFDGITNTTTGTITNGGRLNGTTVEAFGIGSLPTQDPTTVTFLADFTLTTTRGQLKASNVYLYDFAGVAAVLGRINPTTSTGRFAGATGVLYFAGKVTSFNPFTVEAQITGEICFAK